MSNPIKQLRSQLNKLTHNNKTTKRTTRRTRPVKRSGTGRVVGPTPGRQGISKGRNRGTLGLSDRPSGATSRRMQTISEDEYIGEINGSVGFATTSYPCNPGQASMLPWGNKIAALYEEYDFVKLEYYYKREVSEYATQGTTGKIMLSFDYDASDTGPTTKQQVEDSVPHMDGMPSDPVIRLNIDCARIRKNASKYVRPGAQPANTDIKTYDAGNLYVSTYGNQNTTNLGELRVKYTLRLSEPVLEPSVVVGGVAHLSSILATSANNFAGAVIQAGATPSLAGITAAANTITFPAGIPGNYLLYVGIAGATGCSQLAAASYTGSGAAGPLLFTDAGARNDSVEVQSLAGTTLNPAMLCLSVTIGAGAAGVVFTPATITGTGSLDIFVVSLPTSVLTVASQVESRLARMEAFFAERFDEAISSPFVGVGAPGVSSEIEEKRVSGLRPLCLPPIPQKRVWFGATSPSS